MNAPWINPENLIRHYTDKFHFLHGHLSGLNEGDRTLRQRLSYSYVSRRFRTYLESHPELLNDERHFKKCLRVAVKQLVSDSAEAMDIIVKREFEIQRSISEHLRKKLQKVPNIPPMHYGIPTEGSIAFRFVNAGNYSRILKDVDVRNDKLDILIEEASAYYHQTYGTIAQLNADLQQKYLWADKYIDDKRRVRIALFSFAFGIVSLIVVDYLGLIVGALGSSFSWLGDYFAKLAWISGVLCWLFQG
ncbi:hypothetical protein [Ponticaulis koreensis]|uniref:hypothetical protein n=1 Tax=Ponticaulis koreensis TaxID=1123045 RepID=UPI0012DEF8D7|nr:hypothetical protein [Ponticaulis koreensis]